MYLSDKKNGIDRVTHDHEELEVLLESFSKQYEEIVNESENIEVDPNAQPDVGNSNSDSSDQRSFNAGNCGVDIGFESECPSCSRSAGVLTMSNLLFIYYTMLVGFYCYSWCWIRCPCGWAIWDER